MKNKKRIAHDEKLNVKKVRIINAITFLMGLASALTAYIISSYFKEVRHSDNVSVFYIIAYAAILISLLNYHKLIRRFGKSFVFIASLFFLAISSGAAALFSVSPLGLSVVIIYIILYTLCFVGKDIVLESYSIDRMSGRIRGAHLTLMNLGFILGPLAAARIMGRFGFQGVFFLETIFLSLIFAAAFINLRKVNHKFKPIVTVEALLEKVFKRKNVLRIYYISFLLEVFYFIAVAYVPIHLLNLGFDWERIGIVFTIMLIPFVLVQYPAGLLADKRMGEKEMIIFSLLLTGGATLCIFFIESTGIAVWAAVLFFTRVGAALLEILRDSYFYKMIDGADVDIIDFFRTASATGALAASVLSAAALYFFPIKYIFIVLAAILLTGVYPAAKLRDSVSEEELK